MPGFVKRGVSECLAVCDVWRDRAERAKERTGGTALATAHPDLLARLTRHASEAHTPIEEGRVLDRPTVLKDRYIPLGKTMPEKPWGPPPKRKRGQG